MCVCVFAEAGMGVEAKRLFRCFAFIHRGRTQRVKDGWKGKERAGAQERGSGLVN